MKNIVYLNNYLSNDMVKKRENKNIYSQPANNKITGILLSLISCGHKVTILSSGLVNGKSCKKYKREKEIYKGVDVIYCSIFDFPFLNTMTAILAMYKEIKRLHKVNKIDNIIFYNYKPEVAIVAYLAKNKFNIPITVEYEDGYAYVDGISGFKAKIFNWTEAFVSKKVDSAILVNSRLEKKYDVPAVTVRGIVNQEFYDKCKQNKKIKNDKFTILYSGGLDKERGIDVLIESLKYIDFDCRVIVTGKGEFECNDTRVDFLGFVSYDRVKLELMNADLLVQCQLTNHKFASVSFPSKLFEYIATGNQIVSSDVADVKDFAGNALLYYEKDNPKLLARKISEAYYATKEDIDDRIKKTELLCKENLAENVGKRINSIL